MCLIHDTISTKQMDLADYIITDEPHKSCSYTSNRCKMYLVDKQKGDQELKKVRKGKALQDNLVSAKTRKNRTTSNSTEAS